MVASMDANVVAELSERYGVVLESDCDEVESGEVLRDGERLCQGHAACLCIIVQHLH